MPNSAVASGAMRMFCLNLSCIVQLMITWDEQVFEMIGSEIGLTSLHILEIMAEADSNDDGVIEYREFQPVAMDIIQVGATQEHWYVYAGACIIFWGRWVSTP